MIKKYIYFFLNIFILSSCNLYNSTLSSNRSYNSSSFKTYDSYSEYIIPLNNMYDMKDESYAVYFYSEYCPACASLKECLFNFIDNKNKDIDALYLVDIGITKEEDFKKLKSTNGMSDDEILSNIIGVNNIEETYFRSTPCIYILNKINNKNVIKNFYFNYGEVEKYLKNI